MNGEKIILPGKYEHYKGGIYEVLYIAESKTADSDGETVMVYRSASVSDGKIYTMSATEWFDDISVGTEKIPRFKKIIEECIVCAAIAVVFSHGPAIITSESDYDRIVTGHDYTQCEMRLEEMCEKLGKSYPGHRDYGFYTNKFRFVDRYDALTIAIDANQLTRDFYIDYGIPVGNTRQAYFTSFPVLVSHIRYPVII